MSFMSEAPSRLTDEPQPSEARTSVFGLRVQYPAVVCYTDAMSDALARLQALLDEPPSVAAFGQILAWFDDCPDSEIEAELARAEARLRSWPDELRCAGEQLLDYGPDGTCSRLKPVARLVGKLEFEPSHAGCDPELVQLIARAPELGNLTILSLPCEDVDCDGAAAIANSPTLARLKELRLGDRISDFGLCAIARSPHLKELERLELRGSIAEDDSAVILANSPHMAKLVDLMLEDEGLEDDGYWALGMSKYIPAEIRADYLEQLDVTTLLARARSSDLEYPTDSSKAGLIEQLLRRSRPALG
jgi:hypothetical protein